MLLHWGFIVQIRNQRGQQKPLCLVPEWVAALTFTLCVGHKGRDQLQNVLFLVDIGERIVVHTLFEVDGIEDFQLVAILQKGVATLDYDAAFRVSDDITAVHLQKIRLQPESCFTGTRAANNQHVFVSCILGVCWAIAHHQAFRFCQDNVILKLRSHKRCNICRSTPPGRAVLHAVPVLLCIFASQVYGKP